jgi:outer membrane protein OmpA-like peptidoglycan-associated protein/uncharacterized protein YidB (DUF937 family)
MFDSLIQVIARKFGLGDKASWVLSALLELMFNKSKGGLSGFLDKLTSDGLGEIVSSWVGKGEPMAVNSTQIKSAIGGDFISSLASKLGLASGPVGMAIAYMLPKIVSALTPDGVIPDSIPAAIAHYIKDDDQAPVAAAIPEPQTQYQQEDNSESSGVSWWWLLLPLFLLLGFCTLKQPTEPTVAVDPAVKSVVAPELVAPAPAIPSINSHLSIDNDADIFNVSGTVGDNATKESVMSTLKTILGSDKVMGDILVDPAAKDAGWLSNLAGIISALKATPGASLDFDGNNIVLGGNMEQGVIDSLMEKLIGIFGGNGFNISSQAVVSEAPASADAVQELVADTVDTGKKALQDIVASGTVTGESLVSALNNASINFSTGSFNVTPGSIPALRSAAEAINIAPAGTKIEVGGHTDNTGSSQTNARLSQQRAQAVVDALVGMGVSDSVLTAKGYGDSQPIADNSTREGRYQNRRMEFTLQ